MAKHSVAVRGLLVLALVALAAAGCGRRGAPEKPELVGVQEVPVNPDVPGSPSAPDRKFFLDPLLD